MNKPRQAAILCGGLGTRLRPYTNTMPKPMIPCNGKPFLWYLLHQLHEQGISRFVLLTGYLKEKIEDYFGDGSFWGWQIKYSKGPADWDTGQRIWEAKEKLDDRFLLLYSDNFVIFSLDKLVTIHEKNKKPLTFIISQKSPGNLSVDAAGTVQKYDNGRSSNLLDYVELGYMIVDKKETLNYYQSSECSFATILQKMSDNQKISSYILQDSYHSVSDLDRWKRTEEYLTQKKIILIDRDGVINKKALSGKYVCRWDDFEWINETRNAMRLLSQEGFKFIIISNQAGIARGMINPQELEQIHQNMKDELIHDDIEILDIYVCTHHWEDNCSCRKPKPGMLYEASKDWIFRLDKTLFIGDDLRDCQAAFNAGCKSIFIGDASKLQNLLDKEMPIYSFSNLNESIPDLLNYYNCTIDYDNN